MTGSKLSTRNAAPWILLAALAAPLAAAAGEDQERPSARPSPIVVIESPHFKCWDSPALCNCQGAENCEELEASSRCKEGTYRFWEREKIGTCIWNGSR